ncbi:hypothetical protein FS800_05175 [Agrobacterium vitis]|uniref:hypothetical protein n=1 Tax=Allorhizobium ampelinum TaxID=3025782 RepID=UPI001F1EB0B4|nr:hypothetical protein [Allorhizobium ampelinum]MCF1481552.1 hypothetical protein [Allorhizobium ampelinum]
MKFWKLFKHALKLTFNNWFAAIKITAPFIAIALSLKALTIGYAGFVTVENDAILRAMLIVSELYGFVSYLWIAVAWHRFILIDEYPRLMPRFHGARTVSYFLKGLLIGLLVIMVAIPIVLFNLIARDIRFLDLFFILLSFVATFGLITMATRLSTLLPSAALGTSMTIREAWDATRAENLACLGVALMLYVIAVPVLVTTYLLRDGPIVLSILWETISSAFLMMISLSVITTLYGHYIEKRPIGSGTQTVP